jgi:hypothetical protein
VTKVLDRLQPVLLAAWCLFAAQALGQSPPAGVDCPKTTAALYARLHSLGLDEYRVYRVRGAAIDHANLHITFDSGTIAFTEDVCGRTTGAYFEGQGEVLLRPPNNVERGSLALFTGMAILEEQFSSAYLRFNDNTPETLRPFLSSTEEGTEFVQERNETAHNLAELDAFRLLLDFSYLLPTPNGMEPAPQLPRMLHARLRGHKLGIFEVFWDEAAREQIWAGQVRMREGTPFWDIWTSFSPIVPGAETREPAPPEPEITITNFKIRTTVQPPTELRARTEVDIEVRKSGRRALAFELSRNLRVEAVEEDGRAVDFIQNEALEGTELRRKGNDLVAVVFPAQLKAGRKLKLTFTYAGDVLSVAGPGLLYVGARGTWYPNFGFSPAQFDLEFEYPDDWTLVATGKQVKTTSPSKRAGMQVSHWISEAPTVVAGFNLGKYVRAESKAGNAVVEAYGTNSVERSFPKAPAEIMEPPTTFSRGRPPVPFVIASPPPPSPARNVQTVADKAAQAIESFSKWFGPYPYSSLSLTQMPGDLSQGWPGLVFLSSFAFLTPEEQRDLHMDPVTALESGQVLAHETAHQWWGDLILWRSYRDQWFVEGLSNYAALLLLEERNPAQFRQILERYRNDLRSKNKDGEWLGEAGPVTLGQRLISSHFPGGYEAISYERGTWLFHMLRCMLRDAESESASRSRNGAARPEEPFFRVLRKVRERYAGKGLTTQQLIEAFEEDLPRPLWYENRKSLAWFIDGWINGTAMPRLETRDVRITQKERGAQVAGTLAQEDAPDDLVTAVPVYGVASGNSMTFLGIVLADGSETSFRLSAPAGTRKIVLDPRQTILTTLK